MNNVVKINRSKYKIYFNKYLRVVHCESQPQLSFGEECVVEERLRVKPAYTEIFKEEKIDKDGYKSSVLNERHYPEKTKHAGWEVCVAADDRYLAIKIARKAIERKLNEH